MHADDLTDFAFFQKSKLAEIEPAHAKILETYRNDEALEEYRQRLAVIDQTTDMLIREFARVKSAALDVLVDDPLTKPRQKSPAAMPSSFRAGLVPDGPSPMDALAIIDRHLDDFSRPLTLSKLSKDELQTLRDYYDLRVKLASQYIAEKGKPVAAVNPNQSGPIIDLCLVLPFLHVGDAQWTQAQCDLLPEWMKSTQNLQKMEAFALRCRRPLTAYQFSAASARLERRQAEDLLDYLRRNAEKTAAAREYHCAIQCYRSAIAESKARKKDELAMTLQIALAELLARLEHAQLAAGEIADAMKSYPASGEFGRASVMRLRFLYEGGLCEQVLAESEGFQKDDRCGKHLPQIIYITWASARRLNRQEKADVTSALFLEKFPQHPLCADLYFAAAMSRISEGKRDEALKLLEIVDVRFPKSPLAAKVKEIRARLQEAGTKPA